jgi:hypothetical protein
LQLELRRYIRRDGSAREWGPYWYFQFHEGGKRKKLYLGKTNDPEEELARKRTASEGEFPRDRVTWPRPTLTMRLIAVEVPETDPAAETWLQLPGVGDTE